METGPGSTRFWAVLLWNHWMLSWTCPCRLAEQPAGSVEGGTRLRLEAWHKGHRGTTALIGELEPFHSSLQ